MLNYVVFHLKSGLIYGAALCETTEDYGKLVNWASENGVKTTTGELYSPENLLEHAKMHFRTSDA